MTRRVNGRAMDLTLNLPTFAAKVTCPGCPEVGIKGRLVDTLDIGGEPIEVYSVLKECQKDWDEPIEFVNHDTGPGGPVVELSRELKVKFHQMEDCNPARAACLETTLFYDEIRNLWTGELSLDLGVAEFEFYGVWNGLDIDWKLAYYGCAYTGTGSNALGATVLCTTPGKWSAISGSIFLPCCDGIPAPTLLYITANMRPILRGREIDVISGYKVYGVNECCPDTCQESVGCCFGERLDSSLDYTVFNIVQTLGTCDRSCSGVTEVTPTGADGCYAWEVTSCTGPHEICLVCDTGAAGSAGVNGWEHYRLNQGGVLYEPTSGSCNPLSLTFDNIPWLSPWPTGECGGTYSVTVTR